MEHLLTILVSVLAALACLSSANSRCPPSNASNASYSGFGSGGVLYSYSGYGSGILDVSCAELATREPAGLVYFCQNGVVPIEFNCSSSSNYTCEVCERVRECMLSLEELSDLCSNANLFIACTQLEQFDDVNILNFFTDLCYYAASVCFNDTFTGICSEEITRECSNLHDLEYPCDCFEPNATCDACNSVLQFCGDGGTSTSGSGMPSCSDFLQADGSAGVIFLCQSFTSENSCPYSSYTCSFCRFILDCNFPQHQLPDLCSDASIIRACFDDFSTLSNEEAVFYGDICPYIPPLCLSSPDTGICQANGLIEDCNAIIIQNQPCTFVSPLAGDVCTLCNSLLNLCEATISGSGITSGIVSGSGLSGSGVSGSGLSGSGLSGSGVSGSGVSGSGSGSGSGVFPCADFQDDLGVVFFCQTILDSGVCFITYSDITCGFCSALTSQCDLSQGNRRDLCSDSDALLPCVSQNQPFDPYFRAFTRDLCSFAYLVCLQNCDTGICDAQGVISACRDIEEADAPCDTLIPAEACAACRSLLILCQPPSTTTALLPSSTIVSPAPTSTSPIPPSTSATSTDTSTQVVQPTMSRTQTTVSRTQTTAPPTSSTTQSTRLGTTSIAITTTSEKPTEPSPTPPPEPPTFPVSVSAVCL